MDYQPETRLPVAALGCAVATGWIELVNLVEGRDFNKHLKVVNSTVAVIRADEQVLARQQVMIEMVKPKGP